MFRQKAYINVSMYVNRFIASITMAQTIHANTVLPYETRSIKNLSKRFDKTLIQVLFYTTLLQLKID